MNNETMPYVEQKEFGSVSFEAVSIGKNKSHPELNEDAFVSTPHTFAVIDGSTPRIPVSFDGKSGGQFAAEVVKHVLETTGPDINGLPLVVLMTAKLRDRMEAIGVMDQVNQSPDGRPAALFAAARIHGQKLIITAVGDVTCRINGKIVHEDHLISEDRMIQKRVAAMDKAVRENESISDDELRTLGRTAIEEDLKIQVRKYFNNPDDLLGLGIIDGVEVPEKFVRTYEFELSDVHSIELFSDGYYVIPKEPTIQAYEQAFAQGELEDPLRWKKYPAVKSSTPDQFSDDRTILIAKFS